MKGELASQNDLVVEFVPQGQSSQFGARELGYRAQVQAVESETDQIRDTYRRRANEQRNGGPCECGGPIDIHGHVSVDILM